MTPQPLRELNPRQLMHTPYGLRTVQDLYDGLDHCVALHKDGSVVQNSIRRYLAAPTADTLAALRVALQNHDISLAKSCAR